MLQLEDFPENCGIAVLTGFFPEWRYDSGLEGKYVGAAPESIKNQILDAKDANNGMVLATLNSEQLDSDATLHEKMQAAGFKCLNTWVNPNSDNQVWVYYKMLVRVKAKPKVKKAKRRSERLAKRAGVAGAE